MVLAAVETTAICAPTLWLLVLGNQYTGLSREVPIAVASAVVWLMGGFLYSTLIARLHTTGQTWTIAAGVVGQALFIGLHGVRTTFDALVLNLVPAVTYTAVQLVLLVAMLRPAATWREDGSTPLATPALCPNGLEDSR
jgi:hypothetical protein